MKYLYVNPSQIAAILGESDSATVELKSGTKFKISSKWGEELTACAQEYEDAERKERGIKTWNNGNGIKNVSSN